MNNSENVVCSIVLSERVENFEISTYIWILKVKYTIILKLKNRW